ncbi:type II toxin-antitoxin system RelE/ParE family toxin [Xanthobacteraceae bacterium A53D]
MPHPVSFRPAAITDLEAIEDYIALDNPGRAKAFVLDIMQRARRIGDNPNLGRSRNDLRAGLRLLPLDRRVVVAYLIERSEVQILRIFYGGRNYAALMTDED